MRYVYSVVRFVPNPATGEFVNVGAIAGNEDTGDWSVRQAQNPKRARSFGPPESLNALFAFLTEVGRRIDLSDALETAAPELSEDWLTDLHERHRNVIQLSPPAPLVADNAEDALDLVFSQLIEPDFTPEQRSYLTKHRLMSTLRTSYRQAGIQPAMIRERTVLSTGRLHTPIDFAVANGRAVQLAQTWSFQIQGHVEVAKEVKAWGYTIEALKVLGGVLDGASPVRVEPDVDIEVLYARPLTDAQRQVFEEAQAVFADVGATAQELGGAVSISRAAASELGCPGTSGPAPG